MKVEHDLCGAKVEKGIYDQLGMAFKNLKSEKNQLQDEHNLCGEKVDKDLYDQLKSEHDLCAGRLATALARPPQIPRRDSSDFVLNALGFQSPSPFQTLGTQSPPARQSPDGSLGEYPLSRRQSMASSTGSEGTQSASERDHISPYGRAIGQKGSSIQGQGFAAQPMSQSRFQPGLNYQASTRHPAPRQTPPPQFEGSNIQSEPGNSGPGRTPFPGAGNPIIPRATWIWYFRTKPIR